MKILGLTGSIASGKTTVAGWLRECGIPVHDADATVHQLLASGGEAVGPIIDLFGPSVGSDAAGIDRKALGDIVLWSARPAQSVGSGSPSDGTTAS